MLLTYMLHLKSEGKKNQLPVTGKISNVRGRNGCVLDQEGMFFVPFGTIIYVVFLSIQGEKKMVMLFYLISAEPKILHKLIKVKGVNVNFNSFC